MTTTHRSLPRPNGERVLDSWTCRYCGRDFDCSDEMPVKENGDQYECRACVREDALGGVSFTRAAAALRGVYDQLAALHTLETMERAHATGQCMGVVRFYADLLERLSKDVGEGPK